MIASMTGFGRGVFKNNEKEITVEIRTLNNRFLDVSVRLPKSFTIFEDDVRNIVKQHLNRGRVNVVINVKEANNDKNSDSKANIELAKTYLNQLKILKKKLHLGGRIRLNHLLSFTDIFVSDIDEDSNEKIWEDIKLALAEAIENLKKMRISEGQQLHNDLVMRITMLDEGISEIEQLSKTRTKEEHIKLRDRITGFGLTDGITEEISEGRLELEIALLANRIDVTEECIRFKSHNKLFLEILNSEGSVGRKLNFLLQEMTREANTIGAKASDAKISHIVVNTKEEVERIREQVQNIE